MYEIGVVPARPLTSGLDSHRRFGVLFEQTERDAPQEDQVLLGTPDANPALILVEDHIDGVTDSIIWQCLAVWLGTAYILFVSSCDWILSCP